MLIITIVVAVRANVHKQLCVHLCQNENRPAFVFVSPQILHAGIEMYSNNPYIPTRTQNNTLPTNQKGYNNTETTVGKLSARKIQICLVYFCKIYF